MTHTPEAWHDRPALARLAPAPPPSTRPVGRLELDSTSTGLSTTFNAPSRGSASGTASSAVRSGRSFRTGWSKSGRPPTWPAGS